MIKIIFPLLLHCTLYKPFSFQLFEILISKLFLALWTKGLDGRWSRGGGLPFDKNNRLSFPALLLLFDDASGW